jgi:acetyltransferase-like isoleucine patch superfamily enzyme
VTLRRLLERLSNGSDAMLTGCVLGLTNLLGDCFPANNVLRPFFLRAFGLSFGPDCILCPGIQIHSRKDQVSVGRQVFINRNCLFDGMAPVTIGDHCLIGYNVSFATSNHELVARRGSGRPVYGKPIVIEDYVWIGAHAVILAGVTVGRGAVVAAGAVVHRDVPPHTLVGGVPARVIRTIDNQLDDPPASEPAKIVALPDMDVAEGA